MQRAEQAADVTRVDISVYQFARYRNTLARQNSNALAFTANTKKVADRPDRSHNCHSPGNFAHAAFQQGTLFDSRPRQLLFIVTHDFTEETWGDGGGNTKSVH